MEFVKALKKVASLQCPGLAREGTGPGVPQPREDAKQGGATVGVSCSTGLVTSRAGSKGHRCGVPSAQMDSPKLTQLLSHTSPSTHSVQLLVKSRLMAGLNVSLSFFFATCTLCEVARRASKALLPAGTYASFAREAVAAAQLAACCLEMRVLVELGPWAGNFGPDLLLTLIFLLFVVHGATFDGASANPTVALQEFLMAEASLPSMLLKLAAQVLGAQAACVLTRRCWAWELSELHLLQRLMAAHCSSTLRTSVFQGALVEGACAFFFHLSLLHLRHSLPVYRVPALALLVTVMAYTAGPYTSAFFNPALAASVTFSCSGNTLLEYAQVYCLGPMTGMVLAGLLHQGHLPRLFHRNLLYRQKSKYRTPRGKVAPVSVDTQKPTRGKDLVQARAVATGL
ncbi:aquaporin-12 isoform X2 [Nannospalax galili]|nr:aquaporin-12 isoform X2 [Nannospalax galili]